MSGSWDPWTEDNERLAREFDPYMGVDSRDSGARSFAEEEGDGDGPTAAERVLADALDRYMKRPSSRG